MKYLMICLFFITHAQAASESWSVGGIYYEFGVIAPRGYLLNESCVKTPDSCQAGRKAKEPPKPMVIEPGGKNPGSNGCLKAGGYVVIGKNTSQETQGFCVFPDKSMASIDAF